jgi:hypothetical protein
MEGLHIFNKVEITKVNALLIIILFLIITTTISIGLCILDTRKHLIGFIYITVGIISLLLLIFTANNPKPTGKYEYTVTISKNVNLLEFNNKYEIVQQDGELWIIRDK